MLRYFSILTAFLFFPFWVQAQLATDFLPQQSGSVWEYDFLIFDDEENLAEAIRTDELTERRTEENATRFLISSNVGGQYQYVVNDSIISVSTNLEQLFGGFDLGMGFFPVDETTQVLDLFHFNTNPGQEWTLQEFRQAIPISDDIREQFSIPSIIDSVDFVIRLGGKRAEGERIEIMDEEMDTQVFQTVANVRLETELNVFGNRINVFIELIDAYEITSWFAEELGLVKQFAAPYTISTDDLPDNLPDLSLMEEEEESDETPEDIVIPGFSFDLNSYQAGEPTTFVQYERPQTVRLLAPYPNPFNPATRISFELPESQHVTVGVYDITGRKIADLADGRYSAGQHTLTWNAGNRASGLYLIRMTAGDRDFIQRVSFVK